MLNVLIVDDSRVMRAMIRRTLALSGIPLGTVHEAGHGGEALTLLEREWVDLAMVDINMPVMDGETFLRRVREDPALRDLAVVVVSTESSRTRIHRLEERGAAFVHKPFTPERLRETVVNLTGVNHGQEAGRAPVGCDGYDF